ncbi:hypothetical protein [Chromatium okenii]|uniref:hypothetical protein n=1 Tax=Chromatium okenii TaxID=61644 RepID=UPI0018D541F3|nr:hypothetical protein [Chromatium okenii]
MKVQRSTAPASEQHFACTGCGKCCHGWLPLTVADAFANAGRFPLALVWTPVPEVSRAFDLTAQLGTVVQIAKRKRVAVLIAPTAYLPPSFPCPALSPEIAAPFRRKNRCGVAPCRFIRIAAPPIKPIAAAAQRLEVRHFATAPLVYQQRKIVDRSDFDVERCLLAEAPMLRTYADTTLKHYPTVLAQLLKAAQNPAAGRFIVGFASLLRWHKAFDPVTFAQAQHPVLCAFAERTAADPTLAIYHRYYQEAAAELAWFTNADPP